MMVPTTPDSRRSHPMKKLIIVALVALGVTAAVKVAKSR
ncbi:hypothetical protein FBY23_2892 [Nocardioides sp. SLBN-35]|nr:hypothetical protein FBY23_2892 [Nocardioides sp. SLBN-35]